MFSKRYLALAVSFHLVLFYAYCPHLSHWVCWRCLTVRCSQIQMNNEMMYLWQIAQKALVAGRDTGKEKEKTLTQWTVKAQIIYCFRYGILCSRHGWENVQGLHTLQSLQGFRPQFIADASLGHIWPHTRQEQEAVPHSANTAHCCLSFSAGITSQKHPTRRCNCLPHWLAYCLTYMHPHWITLIPKTCMEALKEDFSLGSVVNDPSLEILYSCYLI